MSANVKLYFWALVAKEPNQSKITRLKEEAAHRFHSNRALRSPAHITLIPPLRLSPAQLESLQEDFCEVALCTPPFNLDLTGVNGFPERVVYIHVHPHNTLDHLVTRLEAIRFSRFPHHKRVYSTFTPHVTLAFRDLSPDLYPSALRYFQSMDLEFDWKADSLSRLILLEDGWYVDHNCPFGSTS